MLMTAFRWGNCASFLPGANAERGRGKTQREAGAKRGDRREQYARKVGEKRSERQEQNVER